MAWRCTSFLVRASSSTPPRPAPAPGAVRGAIRLSGEPVAGRLHGGDVERVVKAPGILALVGASRERLADPIGVEAGLRRVAGVEALIDDFGATDRDVRCQASIQGAGHLRDGEF